MKAAQEAIQLARGQRQRAHVRRTEGEGRPGEAAGGDSGVPRSDRAGSRRGRAEQLDGLLGAMPLQREGHDRADGLDLDSLAPRRSTAVTIATVAAAIGVATSFGEPRGSTPGDYEWANRERNMASIAKAIEAYHKDKGHYPPPAILDKDGKPLLSWRVAILPYMENVYINNNGGPGEKPINGRRNCTTGSSSTSRGTGRTTRSSSTSCRRCTAPVGDDSVQPIEHRQDDGDGGGREGARSSTRRRRPCPTGTSATG